MRNAPLPAGSYMGPLGAYAPRGVGGGLGGLGSSMCEDTAATLTRNVLAAAGSVTSALSADTRTEWNPWTQQWERVGGSDVGAGTGAALTASASAWANTCAAEAARENDEATRANLLMLQQQFEQMAAANAAAISAGRSSDDVLLQFLAAQQQRKPAQWVEGVQNSTILLGGAAVVGLAVLAFALK